jgi:hypothetical protein
MPAVDHFCTHDGAYIAHELNVGVLELLKVRGSGALSNAPVRSIPKVMSATKIEKYNSPTTPARRRLTDRTMGGISQTVLPATTRCASLARDADNVTSLCARSIQLAFFESGHRNLL